MHTRTEILYTRLEKENAASRDITSNCTHRNPPFRSAKWLRFVHTWQLEHHGAPENADHDRDLQELHARLGKLVPLLCPDEG